AEALEELDVLGLLGRELEQRARAEVVPREARARVVEHEGQDELLDQAEGVEVAVAAGLVLEQALARGEERERLDAGQRLRQEGTREVERVAGTDQVLDLPARLAQGIAQRALVGEAMGRSERPCHWRRVVGGRASGMRAR